MNLNKKKRLFFALLGLIAVLVLIDQWTKWYVKTHFYLHEIVPVWGNWFNLLFIENKGMAFGWKFGGDYGKVFLTAIRLVAVVVGFFLLKKWTLRGKFKMGCLIFGTLIYAGALGNTIDSLCYGIIYSESTPTQLASLFPPEGGYDAWFHGKVVDMLYFPLIRTTYPSWFPWIGGEPFEFFSPVFNMADSLVTIGVFGLFLFYPKILWGKPKSATEACS